MTNLIVDMSNVVWATRFSEFKGSREREFSKDLLTHSVVMNLMANANKFFATGILLAFDGKNVWRKKLYPEYKMNRERDMYYEEVLDVLATLKQFFSASTEVTAISLEGAEADDVIYVAKHLSANSVIISSDKDFVQLIDDHTRLYAATLKLERTTKNAVYDLFLHCIRGGDDNIKSAYPRVRETRIRKAFEDPLECANLMETKLEDGSKVADKFEFNRKLIDLSLAPSDVKGNICQQIMDEVYKPQKVNQLQLIGALGKMNLRMLAKDASSNTFYRKRFIIDPTKIFDVKTSKLPF